MKKSIIVSIVLIFTSFLLVAIQPGFEKKEIENGIRLTRDALNRTISTGTLPLYFIPNNGQFDKKAIFSARTAGYTLWVTLDGLVFDSFNNSKRYVSQMNLLNINKNCRISACDQTKLKVNYFKGKKSDWRTDIPTTRAILYENAYNNIDLKIYGIEKEVEYDWVVKSGGNPENICFQYEHVKSTEIDSQGNLIVKTEFGNLTHKRPFSYQVIDGKKEEVTVSFKQIEKNVYGFNVGNYDRNRELIIDPAVLVYSTYFGVTSGYDAVKAFASNSDGLVYFTGATYGNDLPVENAYDSTWGTVNYDAWVSIIDTTESGNDSLIYSTYLGDNGVDGAVDIKVDSAGNIYVTGGTWDSSSPYFPTTDGNGDAHGGYDVFVSKLNPNLTGSAQLIYSTIIGGSDRDYSTGLALDSSNNIYVSGYTNSLPSGTDPFPVTADAYRTTKLGTYDFFLAKFSTSTGLQYCTYFGGGTSNDELSLDVTKLAVDSNNYVWLVGIARAADIPVTLNALSSSRRGTMDGFISIFDVTVSGTSGLLYSTYWGGTSNVDDISNIYIDSSDVAYISGRTESDSGVNNFPITVDAYQTTRRGRDAFISILEYSSNTLTVDYSTYFGGSGSEWARNLTADGDGNVYFTGRSISSDLPYVNAYQTCTTTQNRAFAAIIDPSLGSNGLLFSTCLGGSGLDDGLYIGFDSQGRIMLGGSTQSSNFPVVNPFQSSLLGTTDTFVALIDPDL